VIGLFPVRRADSANRLSDAIDTLGNCAPGGAAYDYSASLFYRGIDMNVLNGACAVLVIASSIAACTTPAPAPAPTSEPVKVTATAADVAGCNMLGKVIVSGSSGDAAKEARDQTASIGGNVLLRKNDLVWNGNAYHCPAAAH